ncbi:hypothetical protein ABZ946_28225 [Streptomyces sp. NPDC046324]|uniref:hypothetical protein n=1 Tax=Streptomyces sp. NPDC046324 TaxID=3154915 RepID=UPI0033CECAE6
MKQGDALPVSPRGENWIADMARAVTALGVETSDHATLSRIAALLGMEKAAPARPPAGDERLQRALSSEATVSPTAEPSKPASQPSRGPAELPEEPLQVLRPVSAQTLGSKRGWSEPPLAEQQRSNPEPLPHQPLLPPTSESATLHLLLSRVVREGPVDVAALLDTVCRGDVLSQLPREPVRTLRFGVQVLVDLGVGMQPFHRDQAELVRRVNALAGEHSCDIKYFSESPLQRSGAAAGWTWKAYEPPPPGARVLVLSDFGAHTGGATPQLETEWRQTAQLIRRAACRPLALIPSPPELWPPWLQRLMPVLSWDRQTTTARVHSALS